MSRAVIEEKINGMLDEIYEARVGMTRGEIPELQELVANLAQVSADVLALPDEDSVAMKELLTELRNDLSTISWEMGEIARRLRENDDESPAESNEAGD